MLLDSELTSEAGESGLLSSASSSASLRNRSPAIIDFRFKDGGVFPFDVFVEFSLGAGDPRFEAAATTASCPATDGEHEPLLLPPERPPPPLVPLDDEVEDELVAVDVAAAEAAVAAASASAAAVAAASIA